MLLGKTVFISFLRAFNCALLFASVTSLTLAAQKSDPEEGCPGLDNVPGIVVGYGPEGEGIGGGCGWDNCGDD